MSITDELRSARLEAHLTQEDLARAVGVTRRTVYSWERGESYPRQRMRRRILRVLVVLARAREAA